MARSAQNPMDAVADRMMRRLEGRAVAAGQRSTAGPRGLGRLVARAEGQGPVGDSGRARLLDRLAERTEGDVLGASFAGLARDLRRLRTPLAASGVSEDALVWLDLAATLPEEDAPGDAAPLPGEPILRTIQGWSSRPKPDRRAATRPVARAFGRVRRPSAAGGQVAAAAAVATGKTRSRLLSAIDLLETLSPREAARMAEVLLATAPSPAWHGRAAAADGRVAVGRGRGRPASARPSHTAAVRVAQASGRAVRAQRPVSGRSERAAPGSGTARPSSGRASADGPSGPSGVATFARGASAVSGDAVASAAWTPEPEAGWGSPPAEAEGPLVRASERVQGRLRAVGSRAEPEDAPRSLVPRPVPPSVRRGVAQAWGAVGDDLGAAAVTAVEGVSAGRDTNPASGAALQSGRGAGGLPERLAARSDLTRRDHPGVGVRDAASRRGPDAFGATAEGATAANAATSPFDLLAQDRAGTSPTISRRTRLATPETVWLEATGPNVGLAGGENARDEQADAPAFGTATTRTVQGWSSRPAAGVASKSAADDAATARRPSGTSPGSSASSASVRAARRGEWTGQLPPRPSATLARVNDVSPVSPRGAGARGARDGGVYAPLRTPRASSAASAVGEGTSPSRPSRPDGVAGFASQDPVASVGGRSLPPSDFSQPSRLSRASVADGARGVDAALARVAVRRRDAVLPPGAEVDVEASASVAGRPTPRFARALAPAVAARAATTGLSRALARTDATPLPVGRAAADVDVASGPAAGASSTARARAADARVDAGARPTRLLAPQPAWLEGVEPTRGDAADALPLGAPGEGRVVRTAPRASRDEVTVRVASRAGRALRVAGRDGLDAGTWMRWRAAAVRGDAPASVTVQGDAAADVAAQIARWERVRGLAGAMARPVGPLALPVPASASSSVLASASSPVLASASSPVLASASSSPGARSATTDADADAPRGGASTAPRGRRRAASVTAALRGDRPIGATLAAAADGSRMAEAAVSSSGFTAVWSAGRREEGQPAGYAHRAVSTEGGVRVSTTRPDLAYLEAATAQAPDAAPGLGEPVARTVRADRRGLQSAGTDALAAAGVGIETEVETAGGVSRAAGRSNATRFDGEGQPARATPTVRGVGRAANALFTALARSTTAAEVATVLLDAPGAAAAELAEALPEPAARAVYEVTRMRTLPESEASVLAPGPARQGGGAVAQRDTASAGGSGTNLRAALSASVRRVRRTGGGGGPTTIGQDGHGEGRLMKLSQKLLGLIHLAESQKTDATRQVRRSDEKVGAASQGRAGQVEGADGVTLASLQREVLEAVQRELERSRERGEGGRYGDFWW